MFDNGSRRFRYDGEAGKSWSIVTRKVRNARRGKDWKRLGKEVILRSHALVLGKRSSVLSWRRANSKVAAENVQLLLTVAIVD